MLLRMARLFCDSVLTLLPVHILATRWFNALVLSNVLRMYKKFLWSNMIVGWPDNLIKWKVATTRSKRCKVLKIFFECLKIPTYAEEGGCMKV